MISSPASAVLKVLEALEDVRDWQEEVSRDLHAQLPPADRQRTPERAVAVAVAAYLAHT